MVLRIMFAIGRCLSPGCCPGCCPGVEGCCPGCSGSCLPWCCPAVLSRVPRITFAIGRCRVLSRVLAPDHVCDWVVSELSRVLSRVLSKVLSRARSGASLATSGCVGCRWVDFFSNGFGPPKRHHKSLPGVDLDFLLLSSNLRPTNKFLGCC